MDRPASVDPKSLTWTKQSPATSPPISEILTMAYDHAIRQIVLVAFPPGANAGETWTYEGATWTQQHPATSPALATLRPVMAYDAAIGKLVLLANLTWTYDGMTWTKEAATAVQVKYEYGPLTYDTALKKLVLYDMTSTWTYNGTTWTNQASSVTPPRVFGWSMAYDPALGHTVLSAGSSTIPFSATPRVRPYSTTPGATTDAPGRSCFPPTRRRPGSTDRWSSTTPSTASCSTGC